MLIKEVLRVLIYEVKIKFGVVMLYSERKIFNKVFFCWL